MDFIRDRGMGARRPKEQAEGTIAHRSIGHTVARRVDLADGLAHFMPWPAAPISCPAMPISCPDPGL